MRSSSLPSSLPTPYIVAGRSIYNAVRSISPLSTLRIGVTWPPPCDTSCKQGSKADTYAFPFSPYLLSLDSHPIYHSDSSFTQPYSSFFKKSSSPFFSSHSLCLVNLHIKLMNHTPPRSPYCVESTFSDSASNSKYPLKALLFF